MFDQQHRDATPFEFFQVLCYQFNNFGSQAFGRLVNDDEVRVAHQGAAQGEHLLLATRHHARLGVLALLEPREQLVHVVHRPAPGFAGILLTEVEVLLHRQVRKNIATLRHVADAQVGDFKRLLAQYFLPFPVQGAVAIHQSHDRLGGSGAARAIAPQQRDDLARLHLKVNAMKHMAFTVERLQIVDFQHDQCPSACESATDEPK